MIRPPAGRFPPSACQGSPTVPGHSVGSLGNWARPHMGGSNGGTIPSDPGWAWRPRSRRSTPSYPGLARQSYRRPWSASGATAPHTWSLLTPAPSRGPDPSGPCSRPPGARPPFCTTTLTVKVNDMPAALPHYQRSPWPSSPRGRLPWERPASRLVTAFQARRDDDRTDHGALTRLPLPLGRAQRSTSGRRRLSRGALVAANRALCHQPGRAVCGRGAQTGTTTNRARPQAKRTRSGRCHADLRPRHPTRSHSNGTLVCCVDNTSAPVAIRATDGAAPVAGVTRRSPRPAGKR